MACFPSTAVQGNSLWTVPTGSVPTWYYWNQLEMLFWQRQHLTRMGMQKTAEALQQYQQHQLPDSLWQQQLGHDQHRKSLSTALNEFAVLQMRLEQPAVVGMEEETLIDTCPVCRQGCQEFLHTKGVMHWQDGQPCLGSCSSKLPAATGSAGAQHQPPRHVGDEVQTPQEAPQETPQQQQQASPGAATAYTQQGPTPQQQQQQVDPSHVTAQAQQDLWQQQEQQQQSDSTPVSVPAQEESWQRSQQQEQQPQMPAVTTAQGRQHPLQPQQQQPQQQQQQEQQLQQQHNQHQQSTPVSVTPVNSLVKASASHPTTADLQRGPCLPFKQPKVPVPIHSLYFDANRRWTHLANAGKAATAAAS